MLGHTGSPARIVCVDMTLTQSKVKVKVTDEYYMMYLRSVR